MSAGVGLWVDGPGVTPEGDYTLSVSTDGDAAASANNETEVTVQWGDGFRTTDLGAGDYSHSLFASGWNYEGDSAGSNYTITTQAVTRSRVGAGESNVVDAAVDSLGRRVTIGGTFPSNVWEVRRYNTDGSPDLTFGDLPTTPLLNGNGVAELASMGGVGLAIAVDSSNRVVVAGQSDGDQFTVARLTASGALDGSFGAGGTDGNGVVTTTFIGSTEARATAIAIQPDGQIVVAGSSGTSVDAGSGNFVVVRYHDTAGDVVPNAYAAGDPDTTFSADGKASVAVGGISSLHDVAIDPSGRILTAGTRSSAGDPGGIVVAFTSAGASDGQHLIDAFPGISESVTVVAPVGDGTVLVGGSGGNGQLLLVKLTAALTPDTSFGGGDGIVIHDNYRPVGDVVDPETGIVTSTAPLFDSTLRTLLVQDDLSIVAGGTLINSTTRFQPGGDPQGNQGGLAVFKFDAGGAQDLTFDDDGVVYTAAGPWIGGWISGGHVTQYQDTLVQSGTGANGPGDGSDALGVYVETATFALSVNNVAPTASFAPTDTVGDPETSLPPSNLPTAIPGETSWFAFETTDPSLTDFSDLTYQIDWGDGTTETVPGFGTYFPQADFVGPPFYWPHVFEASGALTVKLTLSDPDGGTSVATFGVNVAASSGIVADPFNPGQTVLYYAAPANTLANKINVNSSTSTTSIVLDGVTVFFAAQPVDRVVVYGNYGDDTIQVNGATSAAQMEFYGGPGHDKLKGGNKADVIAGGDGDDLAVGGVGRDFLIGGFGEDKVIGDADDDILIGGNYVDVVSREAVAAVMAEWTSSGTYAQRVCNLRHGVPAPNGFGPYGLVGYETAEEMYDTQGPLSQNVFDDGSVDKLTGDAGTDWFFANVDGAAIDKITDLLSPEFTDADREFVVP